MGGRRARRGAKRLLAARRGAESADPAEPRTDTCNSLSPPPSTPSPSLERRPSLIDQPEDVLAECVRVLCLQPNRPEWVAALCACSTQLWKLRPPDLRSNYLDYALRSRPSSSEVLALGVLKAEPGASLMVVQRRECLHKALVSSAVSNRLRARPHPALLVERGVLKAEPGVSALVTTRKADLQKALVTSAVSNRLRARPEPASLVERGVLKAEPGVSPWLVEARERLQKELTKHAVARTLSNHLLARVGQC